MVFRTFTSSHQIIITGRLSVEANHAYAPASLPLPNHSERPPLDRPDIGDDIPLPFSPIHRLAATERSRARCKKVVVMSDELSMVCGLSGGSSHFIQGFFMVSVSRTWGPCRSEFTNVSSKCGSREDKLNVEIQNFLNSEQAIEIYHDICNI